MLTLGADSRYFSDLTVKHPRRTITITREPIVKPALASQRPFNRISGHVTQSPPSRLYERCSTARFRQA